VRRPMLFGPLCASLRKFCTCSDPHSGPGRATRPEAGVPSAPACAVGWKEILAASQGLRRDIKGRSPWAGLVCCAVLMLLPAVGSAQITPAAVAGLEVTASSASAGQGGAGTDVASRSLFEINQNQFELGGRFVGCFEREPTTSAGATSATPPNTTDRVNSSSGGCGTRFRSFTALTRKRRIHPHPARCCSMTQRSYGPRAGEASTSMFRSPRNSISPNGVTSGM
jgi:hypothetical protein